jgi:hypothetical protein
MANKKIELSLFHYFIETNGLEKIVFLKTLQKKIVKDTKYKTIIGTPALVEAKPKLQHRLDIR